MVTATMLAHLFAFYLPKVNEFAQLWSAGGNLSGFLYMERSPFCFQSTASDCMTINSIASVIGMCVLGCLVARLKYTAKCSCPLPLRSLN